MEIDPEEFIRKLREARENGVDLVLVCTDNGHIWMKDLSELDMSNPEIKMQGNTVWFKGIIPGMTHPFAPKLIKEIRSVGERII